MGTHRGDELLTGGTADAHLNRELHDMLQAAYMAGYLERELDTREGDLTRRIARKKFEAWVQRRPWQGDGNE